MSLIRLGIGNITGDKRFPQETPFEVQHLDKPQVQCSGENIPAASSPGSSSVSTAAFEAATAGRQEQPQKQPLFSGVWTREEQPKAGARMQTRPLVQL